MAIKSYKPTTNGRRNMTVIDYKQVLSTTKPEKRLLEPLVRPGGRNAHGKITVRHQGGGHKRKYRIIDFKRDKDNIAATIKTIEYDPNRNCFISLISYRDGEKRYILTPKGLKVGDQVISGETADIKPGNTLPLKAIPEGIVVHNIELKPGKGGQMIRAAGAGAQILGRDESQRYTILKLTSGEVRKVLSRCRATIGTLSNEDKSLVNIGKAGRKRHYGVRPTVRGSAMNPNDHPHGGGEGKSPIGRKSPLTPWGKPALGVKTRNRKKASSKLIVRSRHMKKR